MPDATGIMHRWRGQPLCRYCQAPLTPHQAVRGFCDAEACGDAYMRGLVKDAAARSRRDHEALLADAIDKASDELDRAAAALSVPRDALAIAVLPHQDRPLEALPEPRRAEFAERLDALIAEAFAEALDDPDGEKARIEAARAAHEPDERPEFSAGCATCAGSCCTLGAATHAFLSAEDIRRHRLRHPDGAASEARAAYLDRLPARSVHDSCVYHGEAGCVLPRAMRADICNEFHCVGLGAMGGLLAEGARPVALVAQTLGAVRAVGAYSRAAAYQRIDLTPENAAADEA